MLLQRAFTLGHAAAGLGLVDHVVVVERAEVDELDGDAAGDASSADAARRRRRRWRTPAHSVSVGRRRLPPAPSRWAATSPRNGSVVADRVPQRVPRPARGRRAAARASSAARPASCGRSGTARPPVMRQRVGSIGNNLQAAARQGFTLTERARRVPMHPSAEAYGRPQTGGSPKSGRPVACERDSMPRPTERRIPTVFERFTDRARRVVVLAQEEARLLNHNYIGTEHILLGLIHEGEGVAAKALESLGISLEAVRAQVEEIIGHGGQAPSGHIPFTPRAKKVLELSLREALQLGHNYIGTEHILLGLIREGEGVAAQVLVKLGADLSRVRQQVIQLLSGYAGAKEGARPGRRRAPARRSRRARSCSTSSAATSRSSRARRSSTRSSGARRRSSASCRCCRRRTKNNPVLIGEPGVGKTAIVEGLAHRHRRRRRARDARTASSSTRSTSARSSPAPATAATSRSASRRC